MSLVVWGNRDKCRLGASGSTFSRLWSFLPRKPRCRYVRCPGSLHI